MAHTPRDSSATVQKRVLRRSRAGALAYTRGHSQAQLLRGLGSWQRERSVSALPSAEAASGPNPALTIKRKITDEPARVVVAGNFQEHKELPSIFSQLTLFLSSRNWSLACKGNKAQPERTLLGSVGSRKTRGRGSMTSPRSSERASGVVSSWPL